VGQICIGVDTLALVVAVKLQVDTFAQKEKVAGVSTINSIAKHFH
jgi:hypothetical protein